MGKHFWRFNVMATTTPNFGWPVPTSTDLVKDGATAIEALGDSIDASMLDLKGGTTGQVLAKNTNTDMDFVWSAAASGDVTLNGVQTLTNKTLTAPVINLALNAQTGTTYTFVLGDNGKLVTASNASAQTYTIPLNSSVAYATGAQINLIQIGAGQVTVVGAGGVTVLSNAATAASPKCRNQYAALTCIKVATDTWYVIGDIA
jgi:hypothetical protein